MGTIIRADYKMNISSFLPESCIQDHLAYLGSLSVHYDYQEQSEIWFLQFLIAVRPAGAASLLSRCESCVLKCSGRCHLNCAITFLPCRLAGEEQKETRGFLLAAQAFLGMAHPCWWCSSVPFGRGVSSWVVLPTLSVQEVGMAEMCIPVPW